MTPQNTTPANPLPQYWEPRRASGAQIMRMIDSLDPIDHDVEITHLSMDVLIPPLFAYMAYTSGFARTLGNPAVANRIWREGAGDQIRTPVRRDRDTLTFFGEFMRRGHRSPQAQAVFDRVQDIHRQVKGVGNETQVHVLGMLIFDPERFAKAVGHRWFTDKENDARFNFWLGVARGMRLRDVPETRAEFLDWIDDYERRTFTPTIAAAESFKGQLRGISAYVPRPLRPAIRHLVIDTLKPEVRDLLGVSAPRPVHRPALRAAVRALRTVRPIDRFRLDRTWVNSFSRVGPDPDFDTIGYQADAG
ncbi:DUF2236 domain-containing protein [Rhodococcus sp. ZPP]|uniref:oxygenase MpaB family protein n=1 Tax=Rhodococcus sp. ZPP TaxID=2749906 RepID=UPI001AD87836|nr:oxygenase MpaB family protein [Rhodococcus sp. ZPP]QTJ67253.1 DUF2236 domain-containing protein [Rhodococcus sp. ZPP]